ncbi:MAG TPA: FtsQ-type POTRA domain-containing protein [Pseudonocardiaceae bacterium]|nr:FtsQ-type POTRA domain-containing protein [Pseudonocardiaceae bacterium]
MSNEAGRPDDEADQTDTGADGSGEQAAKPRRPRPESGQRARRTGERTAKRGTERRTERTPGRTAHRYAEHPEDDDTPTRRTTPRAEKPAANSTDKTPAGRRTSATRTQSRTQSRTQPRARTRPDRAGTDTLTRPARDRTEPDPKPSRRARRAKRRPTHRRIMVRRLGALSTLLGVVVVVLALLFTPVLGVGSVDVTGAQALTADQVRAAAAVPMGTPMLRLSTDTIAARVADLPRVATVRVFREWPTSVWIDITERAPAGVLTLPGGVHLVDATGYDFATVPAAPAGLPVIQLPSAAPADPRTHAVVAVLAALPAQLRPQVVTIGALTPGSVQFGLANGRTVEWGGADDSARKAAVLGALLSQPGKVYDVSSPDLPTIK